MVSKKYIRYFFVTRSKRLRMIIDTIAGVDTVSIFT